METFDLAAYLTNSVERMVKNILRATMTAHPGECLYAQIQSGQPGGCQAAGGCVLFENVNMLKKSYRRKIHEHLRLPHSKG